MQCSARRAHKLINCESENLNYLMAGSCEELPASQNRKESEEGRKGKETHLFLGGIVKMHTKMSSSRVDQHPS